MMEKIFVKNLARGVQQKTHTEETALAAIRVYSAQEKEPSIKLLQLRMRFYHCLNFPPAQRL